ncbi:MAG: hypothetical protein AB7V42_02075 [Thermoleophilia bacterium]
MTDSATAAHYRDRFISCDDDGVRIRAYYLPWGTRSIPYPALRAVTRVPMNALSGRFRLWGTANPHYWANLDPLRPGKSEAFVLDTGRRVAAFVTPDDPDGFAAALTRRGIAIARGGSRLLV